MISDRPADVDAAAHPEPTPAETMTRAARRHTIVVAGVFSVVQTAVALVWWLAPYTFWAHLALGTTSVVVGAVCYWRIVNSGVARSPIVWHGPDERYVTARTHAGPRTVDFGSLRRVSAGRRFRGMGGRRVSYPRLTVHDAEGRTLVFEDSDVERIADAVLHDPTAVEVTPLAKADLGFGGDASDYRAPFVIGSLVGTVAAMLGPVLLMDKLLG